MKRQTLGMDSGVYDMDPPSGYAPQIGNLLLLLNVAKQRILNSVSLLSDVELDFIIDENTATIGTLVKHMIAMEHLILLISCEKRGFTAAEQSLWRGALRDEMLDRTVKGKTCVYYKKLWGQIRRKTLNKLKKIDDSWLYDISGTQNNYFAWFHLLEDHLCHFGQIKSILKKIPK